MISFQDMTLRKNRNWFIVDECHEVIGQVYWNSLEDRYVANVAGDSLSSSDLHAIANFMDEASDDSLQYKEI